MGFQVVNYESFFFKSLKTNNKFSEKVKKLRFGNLIGIGVQRPFAAFYKSGPPECQNKLGGGA